MLKIAKPRQIFFWKHQEFTFAGTNIPLSKVNIEDDLTFSKVGYASSLVSTTFDPGVSIQMIVSTRKNSRTKTKRSHLPGDGREFMRNVGHPELLV